MKKMVCTNKTASFTGNFCAFSCPSSNSKKFTSVMSSALNLVADFLFVIIYIIIMLGNIIILDNKIKICS